MMDARARGIAYSLIALCLMLWAIVSTFLTFDVGFIRVSWQVLESPESPLHFRALGLMTILMFTSIIVLTAWRGLRMWRAQSWETGHRTIYGLELKLEATVVFGLGLTVFFFIARGLFVY